MCQLSAPTIEGGVGAFDNNAFWGLGFTPPERAKGTALCIKAFIFFALCKFYRFSIGVL